MPQMRESNGPQNLNTNIHQPLGKDRRPRRSGGKTGRTRLVSTLSVFAVALVIGAAGWASWQSRIPAAEKSAQETAALDSTKPDATITATIPADPQAGDGGNIEIIDGNAAPDSAPGVMRPQSGQSGADVAVIFDESGNQINKITPVQRSQPGAVLLAPPNRVGQDLRLAHLPDPAVTQSTSDGDLPIVGSAGERPFDIYARPWSGARGARLAIIVGGLGLSQTGTQYAIKTLPEEITLAFAANGNSLKRWMQEARRSGREIMLQVPFEPFDYPRNDPGQGTLTVAAGVEQNLAELHSDMGRITNYVGITNFMGGRFLSTPKAIEPIMRDLAKRGLMFLDDGTSAQSLTQQYARAFGMPFAASDMVLDATQQRGYILEKLDELERIARRNGTAIGVASAFEVSVNAIADWSKEAAARGIEIVGVAAIADDPVKQAEN